MLHLLFDLLSLLLSGHNSPDYGRDPLISKEVLKNPLFLLGLELVDVYTAQVGDVYLIGSYLMRFNILQLREGFSLPQVLLHLVNAFNEYLVHVALLINHALLNFIGV
jgi:hypothetical protein